MNSQTNIEGLLGKPLWQMTGRAMQEKDVKYTDKNGRTRVRKGSSPLREGVAIIMENTTMEDLLRFTEAVQDRWGIRAVQIHIHRDEGHYEEIEKKKTWKPNYHAHIIWDWMDHDTGKSHKLGEADMSEMQDMLAKMLNMQRGQKKSETGLDHLERNDFILQKQEKEKKRLEEEKRKAQSEKAKAENKAKKAKEEAEKAVEEKDEAVKKANAAKIELSNIESKVTIKQAEINQLSQNIDSKNEQLDGLRKEAAEQRKEIYAMDYNKGWKNQALLAVSAYLILIDDTVKFCLKAILDYAYSGLGCRGGKHGDFFPDDESTAIKKLMKTMSEGAKVSIQKIGDWLVWAANAIGKFNDWELRRAERGVKEIADGNYDWRIERYENRHGLSR